MARIHSRCHHDELQVWYVLASNCAMFSGLITTTFRTLEDMAPPWS